jgi:hypothetical protein
MEIGKANKIGPRQHAQEFSHRRDLERTIAMAGLVVVLSYPLSCSPFQAAGANILLLSIERFKSTAVRQGKRHDHENDG